VVDVEALDAALGRLAELDPGLARLVELRFFGGFTIEETAEVLGVSPATVKRDWIGQGVIEAETQSGIALHPTPRPCGPGEPRLH